MEQKKDDEEEEADRRRSEGQDGQDRGGRGREGLKHSKYHKYLKTKTTCKAHDEENKAKIGDKVLIMETRPLSKDKRWVVKEIITKKVVVPEASEVV